MPHLVTGVDAIKVHLQSWSESLAPLVNVIKEACGN